VEESVQDIDALELLSNGFYLTSSQNQLLVLLYGIKREVKLAASLDFENELDLKAPTSFVTCPSVDIFTSEKEFQRRGHIKHSISLAFI
jgi:hypothetical protein